MSEETTRQLRTRSVGELLDDTFRLYRRKFVFLLISAICFLLPYHILNGYVSARYGFANFQAQFQQSLEQMQGALTANAGTPTPVSPGQVIWSIALSIIYSLLVTPLLYGMVVHMTTRWHLKGEETTLGDASSHAFRRLLPSIATYILLGVIYFIVIFVLVLIIGLLVGVLFTTGLRAIAVAVGILLGLACLCAMIWAFIKLSFVPSVVIEESRMLWKSIARSWVLTKRSFWRLLGYFILVFLLVGILRSAVIIAAAVFVKSAIAVLLITTIVDVLVVPFIMVATANMYTDLLIRTDGLDF